MAVRLERIERTTLSLLDFLIEQPCVRELRHPALAHNPGHAEWLRDFSGSTGLLTLFCRHTSASLLINENAAPAVRRDLERYFARIAPEADVYEHDDEGPDDMPAHIKAALTAVSLSIPVAEGSSGAVTIVRSARRAVRTPPTPPGAVSSSIASPPRERR